jgi:3-oxoacyl-[acyl-carrier-protein] synthase II
LYTRTPSRTNPQKRGATIIAEYMGGAVTCDAHHMTDPRADGLGVSTCIELALKDARIERDQVNYINAHATRCGAGVLGLPGGFPAALGAR